MSKSSGAGARRPGDLTRGFTWAFLTGSAYSIGLGLMKPDAPWWVVIGGPLLAMWMYYSWGKAKDRQRINHEVLGDSLYYLGFLFTLVTLSASLIGLLIAPSADIGAALLLGRFGVALSTTIAGFFGRTVLGQLTPRLDAEEREVVDQIHSHVTKLASQLQDSVDMLGSAHKAVDNAMGESVKKLGEGLEKALTQAGERIAKTLEESIGTIVGEYERSGSHVRKSTIESGEVIRTSMNTATERIASAVADLEKRIQTFEPPQQHVQSKLDDLFAGLTANIAALEKQVAWTGEALAKATEGFQEFAASTGKSTAQFSRTTKGLTTLAEATETGAGSLAKGAEAFAVLERSAASAATGVAAFSGSVTALGDDLAARHKQAIEQRTADADAWVAHVQAMAAQTEQARAALRERLEQDVDAWRSSMAATLAELDAATRAAAEQRADLARLGAEEQDAWRAHVQDLRTATTALREEIDGVAREQAQALGEALRADAGKAGDRLTAALGAMVDDFGAALRNLDDQLLEVIRQHKAWQTQVDRRVDAD